MRKKFFFVGILVFIITLTVTFYLSRKVKTAKFLVQTSELGFDLYLVKDDEFKEFYQRNGQVLIPVEAYTKENLEKVFAWYSKLHPAGTIILKVYTNEKDLEKLEPNGLPGDPDRVLNSPSSSPSNATYIRDERDGSEYYGYDVDPVKKYPQETVFLKRGQKRNNQ